MASQNKLCAVPIALLFVCVLIAAFVPVDSSASSKSVKFNIKPGGEVHTFTESLDRYECSFTSASQGGTNEEWMMSLRLSDDENQFSCTVERPQGASYLFFIQFKVQLKGAKIHSAKGYSQTGPDGGGVPLKEEELNIGDSEVTHAQGKFRSQLSKLEVIGTVKHDEL